MSMNHTSTHAGDKLTGKKHEKMALQMLVDNKLTLNQQ